MANVDFEHGQDVGRYHALKEIKDMITKNRADIDDLVFEYGYRREKWFGIRKGKWVLEDVQPLFEREGIHVDFNERGIWK